MTLTMKDLREAIARSDVELAVAYPGDVTLSEIGQRTGTPAPREPNYLYWNSIYSFEKAGATYRASVDRDVPVSDLDAINIASLDVPDEYVLTSAPKPKGPGKLWIVIGEPPDPAGECPDLECGLRGTGECAGYDVESASCPADEEDGQ